MSGYAQLFTPRDTTENAAKRSPVQPLCLMFFWFLGWVGGRAGGWVLRILHIKLINGNPFSIKRGCLLSKVPLYVLVVYREQENRCAFLGGPLLGCSTNVR